MTAMKAAKAKKTAISMKKAMKAKKMTAMKASKAKKTAISMKKAMNAAKARAAKTATSTQKKPSNVDQSPLSDADDEGAAPAPETPLQAMVERCLPDGGTPTKEWPKPFFFHVTGEYLQDVLIGFLGRRSSSSSSVGPQ